MNDKININRPGQILDYLDTKEHLVDLFKYINELQSNWIFLREWLEGLTVPVKTEYGDTTFYDMIKIKVILDKMNELEGNDKN